LNGSNYLLLELPLLNWPPYIGERTWPELLEDKELRDILPFLRPVIAHPERYAEVVRQPRRLKELRENGYLFQVNLESITGVAGKQRHKLVKKMAKEGLIDLVGTDGHSSEGLAGFLPGFRKKAEKLLGKRAGKVLEENPALVLENKVIEI
jgi:protein-tyrosine phosphatase